MAATATAPPATSPSRGEEAGLDDSNVSSELSDVANDDDISMRQDDGDDGDDGDSHMTGEDQENVNDDASDSESALSDAQSVANSEANDTEAETERLYDTPQHQRQRDVVVDQYNEGEIFEHTPSKLRRAATLDDANDDNDDDAEDKSAIDDVASSPSEKSDAAGSPRKNATTQDTSVDDEQRPDSQDRKRKRSLAADNSDSEQPLRKRTGSVGAVEADIENEAVTYNDDNTAVVDRSRSQTPAEDGGASPAKQDVATEDNTIERETRSTKKTTRSESRRKDSEEEEDEPQAPAEVQENEGEDEQVSKPETAEAEVDEEADAAAKSAEEAERKQEAFKDWSHIEEMFGVFRDRLYKDRLQRLEEEEQSLLADEPTHREFLNMKKCLDDRLAKSLREIAKENELKQRAHEKRFVAERAQIWSQFAQGVREKRESTLESLNKEWYDVVAARRNAHSLPDYGVIFPKDQSQRVRNAVAYNTEVSTLAGMAKYKGFPAVPDIKGAFSTEISEDFSAIEQARTARRRSGIQPRDEYQPPSFSRLGPAGEQFLRETPWANPNHMAHRVGSSQQSQPRQADGRIQNSATAGRGIGQQPIDAPVNSSTAAAVDGPLSQQRSPAVSNHLSESPELARHALKKRTALPNPGRESSTAAA